MYTYTLELVLHVPFREAYTAARLREDCYRECLGKLQRAAPYAFFGKCFAEELRCDNIRQLYQYSATWKYTTNKPLPQGSLLWEFVTDEENNGPSQYFQQFQGSPPPEPSIAESLMRIAGAVTGRLTSKPTPLADSFELLHGKPKAPPLLNVVATKPKHSLEFSLGSLMRPSRDVALSFWRYHYTNTLGEGSILRVSVGSWPTQVMFDYSTKTWDFVSCVAGQSVDCSNFSPESLEKFKKDAQAVLDMWPSPWPLK